MKTVGVEKDIQNVYYEYKTFSVILTCAISGTNGSSGLGSVKREQIESSTCACMHIHVRESVYVRVCVCVCV
jgi:hypothetical protein